MPADFSLLSTQILLFLNKNWQLKINCHQRKPLSSEKVEECHLQTLTYDRENDCC